MGDTQPESPLFGPDLARFPNTRLRAPAPDGPDSNNLDEPTHTAAPPDPSFSVDPDTCRICRGEGTREEPLFFPCKCSGSIKYVHQDCLMEWLSHSQKKHCELCKTPFRFTKLYAPDMPKALPVYIFISHMTKYMFRNVLVWLRAILVASVWLGWLPYLMRSVWAFLFWISDEGLGGAALFGRSSNGSGGYTDAGMLQGATVCPSSPLFAATTTVATLGGVGEGLSLDTMRLVRRLYSFNLSSADPLYSTILRLLFGSVGVGEKGTAAVPSTPVSVIERAFVPSKSHPSLLSEVSYLRNLTRHNSINRTLIATFEGQIITILVIVCFILIILVRDYVVQQQPDIMRAGFGQVEVPAPAQPAPPQPEPVAVPDDAELPEDPELDVLESTDASQRRQAPIDQLPEDHLDGDIGSYEALMDEALDAREPGVTALPLPRIHLVGQSQGARVQGELGPVAPVQEYLKIYREAGGDPDKILRIARELNMEDKLEYWIGLTRLKTDRGKAVDEEGSSSGAIAAESLSDLSSTLAHAGESPDTPDTLASDQSPDWAWMDDVAWQLEHEKGKGKGKGKRKLEDEEEDQSGLPPVSAASSSRPRANTDGPKVNDTLNQLGNNSWSFTDLPDEPITFQAGRSSDDRRPFSETSEPEHRRPQWAVEFVDIPSQGQQPNSGATNPAGEPELALPATREDDPAAGVDAEANQTRQAADAQGQPRPQPGLFNAVTEFMWRGIDDIDPAELAAVDIDDFGDDDDMFGQDDLLGDEMERDREVVEAAVEAGLDPEAIEDAEDLEGILELLGMRGPVAGLFQNAIFCAFLVSITIFVGIFVPYNIGRITVWTIANPMRPARMLFSLSKFIQDCAVIVVGVSSCATSLAIQTLAWLVNWTSLTNYFSPATTTSWAMAVSAANRISSNFMKELPIISASEMRNFSAISHEALLAIQGYIWQAFSALGHTIIFVFGGDYSSKSSEVLSLATNVSEVAWAGLKDLPEVVTNPSSWVLNFSVPESASLVDPELAYWNGVDRFWAIVSGYVALSFLAGFYLRRGSPFSTGQAAQEWEGALIDALNQASGVMKVILIIGIEMLVFPLYCGMLLDIALLPLFEETTIGSRLLFTMNYPVTSVFVHWFVGTGYMFHFALFVSMCRKIMRKGVLYFIRDPDDPEFHPVRDVLERSVTTQLRKILFSAFVYGALVIMCLGGVVWGLALALPNVLPVHYSSNEPVLEFPIDLLFYNFLMPLAVKFFKPSEGLHAMYTWWFRKCARALRITWFLFGERRVDEEGHLALRDSSPYRNAPWWTTLFLELDPTGLRVIPKTWNDVFEGGTDQPSTGMSTQEILAMTIKKHHLVKTGQLIPDGRFVRTPASDQVKIPKGQRVFLEVNEDNMRRETRERGTRVPDLYSSSQYQFVYVPPHFRARIFIFILLIWVFAAATGVGITIVPLVFGRQMFRLLMPSHIRTNDIYAFSIGVYILTSVIYILLHSQAIYQSIKSWISSAAASAYNHEAARRVWGSIARVAKVLYAYFFLFVAFPFMVSSLMELYAIIPLHEFMYSSLLGGDGAASATSDNAADLNPRHTIRLIQGWTVGLLYLKLSTRVIVTWFPNSRLASAARAVLRRGWLNPDLSVLTRAFVVPGLVLWAVAVSAPLVFARFTVAHGLADAMVRTSGAAFADQFSDDQLYDACLVLIYRLSFPFMALSVAATFSLLSMFGVFRSWKVRIRDEAYLIGERLHNFGGAPNARGAWKASGSRL
ncbi:hypothetical protein B0T16DRAFT_423977 [Cercophora newfieldiana]|uniref:RING-type E3 ubiquitin transferase n=1 Tax=Cercophora newfieldiana TaxID=92897 RepID=A0AA40CID4_9PEZI|nr:hypothetical protein B0T16DRAFT_423977 [Cercophora newfieldiana]